MRHHDVVIIGTGSGNSLVTPELEGLDIAIVEEGTFGGTCLNVGCIPTKMFVLPADRVVDARSAPGIDVTFEMPPRVDWESLRDRIFGRIDPIAAGGRAYRRSQDFVTVYAATARFVGPRHLALSTGEEITADQVVVAVGSRAVMPDLDGLREVDVAAGVHTSDTVMRLDALPPRMVVLGGGYIACELAHVFDGLGVEVTQVQRSAELLRREDDEVRARFTRLMRERYDLRTLTTVSSATRCAGVWRLELDGPQGGDHAEAEVVLVAHGRHPNGDRLDAEAGGLRLDDAGLVEVDAHQRAVGVEGVWALGDCCNVHQLKHVANHEARVVAHNLAVTLGRKDARLVESDHRFVPHGIFTHPQVAGFGPTRAGLDAIGAPYVAKTQELKDIAYGWALGDIDGFLTVYANPTTRRIVAAHGMGPQISAVIQPLIQAASFGQDALEVARRQYWIHPALSELVENALLGLELTDVPPTLV